MAISDPKLAKRLAQMTSEQKLDAILEMLLRIARKLDTWSAAPDPVAPGVASEAELDSKAGDEEIRKDPKRWTGETYAGKRMSETTPDYLDEVASFADYCAAMSEAKARDAKDGAVAAVKERMNAGYRRATARRARGWAARLRAGWRPPGSEPLSEPQESEQPNNELENW
jgi:hypothetical protein